MAQPIIAIICDFDGTLGPDTTTFLLKEHGVDPKPFWEHITKMVEDGWDPAQAYMDRLLKLFSGKKHQRLSKKLLREIGSKLELFPGVPEFFSELQKLIKTDSQLKTIPKLKLEYYIVSGGIEEMIRGSKVAKHINGGIFGCDFHYNEATGSADAVKRTISFTEKTRFIYAINKGITEAEMRRKPYSVNDVMAIEARPIPFSQMVYIGDGPSDIPCMSMIKKSGGQMIGVDSDKTFTKGYELARGDRITLGPYSADYRKNSHMRRMLQRIMLERGNRIGIGLNETVKAPTH